MLYKFDKLQTYIKQKSKFDKKKLLQKGQNKRLKMTRKLKHVAIRNLNISTHWIWWNDHWIGLGISGVVGSTGLASHVRCLHSEGVAVSCWAAKIRRLWFQICPFVCPPYYAKQLRTNFA